MDEKLIEKVIPLSPDIEIVLEPENRVSMNFRITQNTEIREAQRQMLEDLQRHCRLNLETLDSGITWPPKRG